MFSNHKPSKPEPIASWNRFGMAATLSQRSKRLGLHELMQGLPCLGCGTCEPARMREQATSESPVARDGI
jgi:coenzyme F420-reducing hydrogenase gamma subunit